MTGYSEADARAIAIVIYQARALWGRDICTHVRTDGFAIFACGTGAVAACLGCSRLLRVAPHAWPLQPVHGSRAGEGEAEAQEGHMTTSTNPACPTCGVPMRRRGYFGPDAIWACDDCGAVHKRQEPAPVPGFVALGPQPGPPPLPLVGEFRRCPCGDRVIGVRVQGEP